MDINIHPQILAIVCSFLGDTKSDLKIKRTLLPITIKYPFYTEHKQTFRSVTRLNGLLHSKDDQPAITYFNSSEKCWYKYGLLHRNGDKPAVISENQYKYWYKDGELHRDGDKPASITPNGYKRWYQKGKLHRDGDKPAIIWSNDTEWHMKQWYKYGLLHREGGEPAVMYSYTGLAEWWINGIQIK